MDWGRRAKTEKEKQAYIDLARTWTQAAMQSERILVFNSSPPEARARKAVSTAFKRGQQN